MIYKLKIKSQFEHVWIGLFQVFLANFLYSRKIKKLEFLTYDFWCISQLSKVNPNKLREAVIVFLLMNIGPRWFIYVIFSRIETFQTFTCISYPWDLYCLIFRFWVNLWLVYFFSFWIMRFYYSNLFVFYFFLIDNYYFFSNMLAYLSYKMR